MQNKDILSRVVGTLKHGRFYGDKKKHIFIIYGILASFCVLGAVFNLVLASMDRARSSQPMPMLEFVFGAVLVTICLLLPVIIAGLSILHNEKIRKELILWVEDAIETDAYAKEIGRQFPAFSPAIVKIRVSFKINGMQFLRESIAGPIGAFSWQKGHQAIWRKYANRSIQILYSPKYDQVMVLKDHKKTKQ
ncbi:MAG: hypothetical protein K2M95_07035 [Clostridiales bacterium]|nr:hypothetical protein [Clostridiales bacterium]